MAFFVESTRASRILRTSGTEFVLVAAASVEFLRLIRFSLSVRVDMKNGTADAMSFSRRRNKEKMRD